MESAPPPPSPHRGRLVAAYLAVCVVWGSTYFGIRVALEAFPPFFLGAARFLLAGGALYAFARMRREPAPRAAEWASALVTGSLFFVVGNGLVNLAERSVSSGLVSVLVATMPLWATLFAPVFGQRVTRLEALGVALGLVGVVVLRAGGELRASPAGAAFALMAPMGWALASLASPRLPLPAGTMMRTAAPMLGGGAAMLVVSLCLREPLAWGAVLRSARSLAALAYLAVFGSLVGFSAYSLLLKHTRPVVATSYAYVNPVIAVVLGVAFAGERFGAGSFAGAAIVLAAVVLVGLARARSGRRSRVDLPGLAGQPGQPGQPGQGAGQVVGHDASGRARGEAAKVT
jgi:drug/metabolite transporter (DMT)-like permease